jgi:hypothetical protein
MQVKEIENWEKLNAKKLTILGCDFYYTGASKVADGIYSVNLIEQLSKEVYFRVDMVLDKMELGVKVFFPSASSFTPKHLYNTITKDAISNPNNFGQAVHNVIISDSITFTMVELLAQAQSQIKHSKSNSGGVLGGNFTAQGMLSGSVLW